MLNPSTNHLRLHIEDPWGATRTELDLPAWQELRSAFHDLTGWQLDCKPGPLPPKAESVASLPQLFGSDPGELSVTRGSAAAADPGRERASELLARAVGAVLLELQLTRQALQQREAELATAVPVVARHVQDDVAEFNHRLQAVLRGTVEGLGGCAAALYLLDDATTELKLRTHWGLSSLRFLEPARPLRGAVADLEALTGHAVVLEDATLFDHWNVPENFASCVCVPVSSPDTLLGTFWFFSDEPRQYTDAETQLLEIVAGRLAAELERRVLLGEAAQSRESREQSAHVSTWHEERCRPAAPVIDGWQIAATTVMGGRPRGDFHRWQIDAHDRLWLASAAISGPPAKSMLTSTLLQGAVQTIFQRPCEPLQMVQHLNEVLWSSSTGGEAASFFCGNLDPKTGRLQLAVAGSTDAYILRPHGWEPIVVDTTPLGHDTHWQGQCRSHEIHSGDILVVISDRHLVRNEQPGDLDTTALAEALLHHVHLSAKDLAGLAAHLISKQCRDPWARSILVAKRSDQAGDGGWTAGGFKLPESP